jgi:uncharacterized membrane protein YfcA
MVVFGVGVLTTALAGWDWWWALLVMVPIGVAGSWALDPRKPWWGEEPLATLADPERRRAYRRSELRFALWAFVFFFVVAPVLASFLGVGAGV